MKRGSLPQGCHLIELIESMIVKQFRIIIIVILALAAGIWACNKDSDSSIPDTKSNINVFIANPDNAYDIVLDTTTLGTSLVLGEYTGYKTFQAKRYSLYIYPAGRRDTILIDGQISLRNGHYYSVFFGKNHNNVLQLLAAEDKLGANSSKVGYLRVVDLSDTYYTSSAALNLDFYLDSLEEFSGISYLGVANFKQVSIGSHKRDVRWIDSSLSLLYNNIDTFHVEAGKSCSWIVYGNALVADSFKVVNFQHN